MTEDMTSKTEEELNGIIRAGEQAINANMLGKPSLERNALIDRIAPARAELIRRKEAQG